MSLYSEPTIRLSSLPTLKGSIHIELTSTSSHSSSSNPYLNTITIIEIVIGAVVALGSLVCIWKVFLGGRCPWSRFSEELNSRSYIGEERIDSTSWIPSPDGIIRTHYYDLLGKG
mmetsp:Transcript_2211/g.2998  ORF Transcript_2211/g.2998 Transcript_2211/m.2998 type:complete len:115 (-) Transcript_2211:696-1040(-)